MEVNKIYQGDCIEVLKTFPDKCIDCCVTSPPYFGLRDYGHEGQIGLEETPELFVSKMVEVFTEVKRVLKDEGTLWLNLGDSYCASATGSQGNGKSTLEGSKETQIEAGKRPNKLGFQGIKPKDLLGIPWMVAFALRSAGYYLRCDIIWSKKNCMPESVEDRPTKSHEYLFLLSKSPKYYYDHEAIKEDCIWDVDGNGTAARKARQKEHNKSNPVGLNAGIRNGGYKDSQKFGGKNEQLGKRTYDGFNERWDLSGGLPKRNKRSVWTLAPAQFPEAHFATFPERLITDCIKAGCPENGIVLDPFMGAGTTGLVARKLNRNYVGIELNAEYIKIAEKRIYHSIGIFQ